MAPLPQNSTARLFLDYATGLSGAGSHTMQIRYLGSDRSASAAQARVASILTAAGAPAFRQGWRIVAARTALAGEDFTVPQNLNSSLASFLGSNTTPYPRRFEAREFTFVGRGVDGPRKTRLSFYGIAAAVADLESFRGSIGAPNTPAWANSAYAALVAASSPIVAIDGSQLVWYSYVNMNYNSYWERRLRTS